eukprot:5133397-Lingulodinium_polyedra.AAC.1
MPPLLSVPYLRVLTSRNCMPSLGDSVNLSTSTEGAMLDRQNWWSKGVGYSEHNSIAENLPSCAQTL